ncbi:aldo/keto reductase [Tropicimonas sp. IMCC34011]|uniref:aldo/keto reductase n=1 Tax=Tropicimonas sp. IMCC34011 TaxID=2248759 RepID=UPI000E28417F|nr:aldo/keto reductase [Tropicimonas sp. IMCC34011]
MDRRPLGETGLDIAPVVFGGNVLGWTVDRETGFRLLSGFTDAGLNAIDTADIYLGGVDGGRYGASETMIGEWLAEDQSRRDRIVLITKVGGKMGDEGRGLSPAWIEKEVDASLTRLQTDRIDLYLSHFPDDSVAHEDTLGAYQRLIEKGKITACGASNYSADQLADALAVSRQGGLPRYSVIQPEFNLIERDALAGPMRDLVDRERIGVITYFSLASGFLTGKYRSKDDLKGKSRAGFAGKYLDDPRAMRVLEALDDVAKSTGAAHAEVALAWVRQSPGITAPIASATSEEQLASLVRGATLELSPQQMQTLNEAGQEGQGEPGSTAKS